MSATQAGYDYRKSHQTKDRGAGYVNYFHKSPRLRILWEIEKSVLNEVLALDRFQSRSIRYLDFACGTGRITSFMEQKVDHAVGVDVSEPMLEAARQHVTKAKLIHRDITEKGLDDEEPFDLITAFRFFANAHPSLRFDVMRALSSLLAPDGVFVFNNHQRTRSLTERARRAWSFVRKDPSDKFRSTMDDREVEELLDAGSLRVIKRHHLGVIPSPHLKLTLPESLFRRMEFALSRRDWASGMAQYHMYICEKR